MSRARSCWLPALLFALAAPAQQGDKKDEPQPELPKDLEVPAALARTPTEELATFRLQPGFRIELCAAEPLVQDPVAAVFDPAGRLWVVEMRSFMRDVDARGERNPDGCIAVLEDRDGDGRMDARTEFLSGLVLPRAVLPLHGGALVIEPPNLLWAPDEDGDLRADRTDLIAGGFEAGMENPEHAGNGLLWGLDNAIHLANDPRQWRWSPAGFAVERAAGGGQWGLAQDDRGRLYFDYNEDWLRCDLVPGRYAAAARAGLPGTNHRLVTDTSVWPIRITPGVNRGYQPGMLRDWVLTRHTAVCGPHVYRGLLFGPEYVGNAFVCEPAAQLVRRFVLEDQDARMHGANPYAKAEFLASTDERFRPVNAFAGPDGALYLVDMYRGVIQHKNFVTTWLRRQILGRALERPIGLGRIWRIVPAAAERRALPRFQTVDDLLAALQSADGFARDTAQRLLVQRDERTALPAVRALLREASDPRTRIHALAVLDGLAALDRDDLRRAFTDCDPGVLCLALQHAGPLLAEGDRILWAQAEVRLAAAAPCVRWHLALALADGDGPLPARAAALLAGLAAATPDDELLRGAVVAVAQVRRAESSVVKELAAAAEFAAASPARRTFLLELAKSAVQSREAAVQEAMLDRAAACMQSWQQQALLAGVVATLPKGAARAGFLTFAATPTALAAMARTGDGEVQKLVLEILGAITIRAEAVAANGAPEEGLTPAEQARVSAGERVFGASCAACHQAHGRGMDGLAPPLRDSEWVIGKPERLLAVALKGLRGKVEVTGRTFEMEMAGQGHLADADLAAALSYVRHGFGHRQSLVTEEQVAAARARHAQRQEPFTAQELLGL